MKIDIILRTFEHPMLIPTRLADTELITGSL